MRIRTSTAGSEHPRVTAAFTLIELVVVLVIMGVVLGMTIPRFGGMLGGSETTRFSKELAAYLRNARELALVRNTPVRIEVDTDLRRVSISTSEPTIAPLKIPVDVEVEVEVGGHDPDRGFTFFPLGNATPGRIVLRDPRDREHDPIAVGIERMTGDVYIE